MLISFAFCKARQQQLCQTARGLFRDCPPVEVAQCDRRPRFYGSHGGSMAFSFFRWQAGFHGATTLTSALVDDD